MIQNNIESNHDQTELKKELNHILAIHNKWIDSKGKEGEKPDLSRNNPFIRIHNHHHYRNEILNSEICGCFYCCQIFSSDKIIEWHGEDENGIEQIAICPKCGINSVLGSASGYPINSKFLKMMHEYFFSPMGINYD